MKNKTHAYNAHKISVYFIHRTIWYNKRIKAKNRALVISTLSIHKSTNTLTHTNKLNTWHKKWEEEKKQFLIPYLFALLLFCISIWVALNLYLFMAAQNTIFFINIYIYVCNVERCSLIHAFHIGGQSMSV